MDTDPYSMEIRYTLDLLAYFLVNAKPDSVRIATHSIELAKSTVRRLIHEEISLIVESHGIAQELEEFFGLKLEIHDPAKENADSAIFPFSIEEGLRPCGENHLIIANRNALSYKTILYPGKTKFLPHKIISLFKSQYILHPVAHIYPPRFIFLWTLAKLTERINSALYFRLEDQARLNLIDFGHWWRFSYIVVFVGRHSKQN